MADEKKESKLRTDASGIAGWVDAYWGNNNEGFDSKGNDLTKKTEKFKHLQHLASFATVCYYVNNNSPAAHIDFYDTNYTHMSSSVEKAAKLILKLMQIRFENSDPASGYIYPLTRSDFDAANASVGLFSSVTDKIVNDYIGADGKGGLVDGCSHFVPIFKDNGKTVKNLKEINDDETIVAHHGELVGAFGGDNNHCSLDLKNIRMLSTRTVEKASSIWEEVEASKSSELKKLVDHTNEAFYKREELIFKTGKIGALTAGSAFCVGCVVSGVFLPALGLIPLYGLAKSWLPDWAKAFGNLIGNWKERKKDRRNQRQAEAEEYYLTHNGKIRLRDRLTGRMPREVVELMKKQLKTMSLWNGADNLAENTSNAIANAGKLDNYDKIDDQVPADISGRWNNYLTGIETMVESFKKNELDGSGNPKYTREQVFNKIKMFADDLKKFDDKVPEDDQKRQIYRRFYDQTMKFFDSMLFEREFNGTVEKAFADYSQDETIKELIKKDKFGENLLIRLDNMRAFISEEKKPIFIDGKPNTFNMIGGDMGVGLLGLTANDSKTAKDAYVKIEPTSAVIDKIIDDIYAPTCDENASVIGANISTLANKTTKKYLTHLFDCRKAATLFTKKQLDDKFDAIGSIYAPKATTKFSTTYATLIQEIATLKMRLPTGEVDKNNFGQIYSTYDSKLLGQIKDDISAIHDDGVKIEIFKILNEQLKKLNTSIQLDAKANATKSIKGELNTGSWKFFGSNFKNPEGKTGPVIDSTTLTYSDEGFKNANIIFDNISSIIPGVGKLDYLYFKLSDFMYTKVFQPKIQEFRSISPKMNDLVDFFRKVKTARYLNDAQKSDLISQASSLIIKSFNSEYNIMREDYVNKFDISKFSDLTLDLESGGFAEVFKQDASLKPLLDAIQDVKDSKRILSVLDFDKIKADSEELKFISQVYFYQNDDKNSAPRIRPNGDKLKQFMASINSVSANFSQSTYDDVVKFAGDKVISNLKSIYNAINAWIPANDEEKRDKYAASLVLKNKAVSLFRSYVRGYLGIVTSGASSEIDGMEAAGKMDEFNTKVIDFWNAVIGNDIDALLVDCIKSMKYTTSLFKNTFGHEVGLYKTAQTVVDSSKKMEM